MADLYHDGNRQLQDRFDTRRLADRIEERISRDRFDDDDRAFIESRDMFFLATADEDGMPQCSYKGGEPGFVRVVDERTLAFPSYDGNGMYLSLGNLLRNPQVGILFIDFASPKRLRVNGIASIDEHDPLLAAYPEAQLVVRVRARDVLPNCPRYVHRMELVERSRFVPHDDARDADSRLEAARVVARRRCPQRTIPRADRGACSRTEVSGSRSRPIEAGLGRALLESSGTSATTLVGRARSRRSDRRPAARRARPCRRPLARPLRSPGSGSGGTMSSRSPWTRSVRDAERQQRRRRGRGVALRDLVGLPPRSAWQAPPPRPAAAPRDEIDDTRLRDRTAGSDAWPERREHPPGAGGARRARARGARRPSGRP